MPVGLRLQEAEHGVAPLTRKTFCEFFAGIGLVRDALIQSGWQCVYANDIDPKKQAMYDQRFGRDAHFHLGDVWDTDEVVSRIEGRPLLATASFPCIDMSLAGHCRGFCGEHSSTLFGFTQAMETLADRRPRIVMLENVTGFLTSKDGKDFETAVRALADLGYWIDAFVLDAKYFLPQSRPRVFIVGIDDSIEAPFASRESGMDWLGCRWQRTLEKSPASLRPARLKNLMQSIELPTGWVAFNLPKPPAEHSDIAKFIDLDSAQDWWDLAAVTKHHDMMSDRHREQVDCLLADGSTAVGTIFRRKRDGKTRAEVRFDGMAGCLRTPKGGSARQIVIAIEKGILRMRWMSAREYSRLQGAGDFPLVENNIQNLFGFGDAVCVPVIQWIDTHLLTPLSECITATQGAGCSQ